MLVQNQTTFSASHVQAYWAHLDHVVSKNEVSEHKATPEAVAEKQPRFKTFRGARTGVMLIYPQKPLQPVLGPH